jgi:hypothetical protein
LFEISIEFEVKRLLDRQRLLMNVENRDFYFHGKQVVSAHYDRASMVLEIIYRSGKRREIKEVSPQQLLTLISVISIKSLLACTFLYVHAPLAWT